MRFSDCSRLYRLSLQEDLFGGSVLIHYYERIVQKPATYYRDKG